MSIIGEHVLLDVQGDLAHWSEDELDTLLVAAARAGSAQVLSRHFHPFGESAGITGVVLLAESHMSVHTWPERNYAAFDIFMCGQCDTHKAVQVIKQADINGKYHVRTLTRCLPKR